MRKFYSEVWTQAGAARECPLRKVGGAFDFDCGGVHLRVRNNLTSLDDPITLQMAGDKALVHGLLRDSAVPVPAHVVCRAGDVAAARRFMTTVGRPCVVKPARRTAAGAGVTTGISGLLQLVRAMAHAGAHCDEVIVEQEVEGENLRLLYFDGELLDAVRRCSPIVTGDGATTIKRLVDAENVDRLQGGIRGQPDPPQDRLGIAGHTAQAGISPEVRAAEGACDQAEERRQRQPRQRQRGCRVTVG